MPAHSMRLNALFKNYSYRLSLLHCLIVLKVTYSLCSRPSSFAVLLIRGKTIVVIFVQRGVGPSLFRGRSCAGARSNTQQPASARMSQKLRRYRATPSVLRLYFSQFLELIVVLVFDHPDNFQPGTPTSSQ
jgi:uncharacterized membrane protein YcfT